MTILYQRNNQVFQPGLNDIPVTIDASITQINIVLTHRDWPDGPCARFSITWSNGETTGVAELGGGQVVDKQGNPTGGTTTTSWGCFKPEGITAGTVHLAILQRFATAVLVEGT